MTPQEEQQLMQAYVRQQLLARGQQLMPGQQPISPEEQQGFMQRPPLAPGVGSPATPGTFALPVDVTGGYSQGKLGQTTEPFNARAVYRHNVPF